MLRFFAPPLSPSPFYPLDCCASVRIAPSKNMHKGFFKKKMQASPPNLLIGFERRQSAPICAPITTIVKLKKTYIQGDLFTSTPQFQYQKENCQAANQSCCSSKSCFQERPLLAAWRFSFWH